MIKMIKPLEQWHDMLVTRNFEILNNLLADDVIFRSPVAFTPYVGHKIVFFILTNVIQVLENFSYHQEFYTEDHKQVVLEFSANIRDAQLKGVDIIRFNTQGKIQEIEVLIRPKKGLEALEQLMSERIKQHLHI